MIQVLASVFQLILRLFSRWKCDLRKFQKATFQVLTFHFELNFSLLKSSKCDLVMSIKLRFTFSHPTLNSFSASWVAQNANCVGLKKRCFKALKFDLLPFISVLELWPLKFLTHISKSKVKVQISKPLKHLYFDLTQVAFWDSQEAENEFKVRWENVKRSFIDFI